MKLILSSLFCVLYYATLWLKVMKIDRRQVKTVLKTHSIIDNWFPCRYSLDLYSGCSFSCKFCPANFKSTKKLIIKENAVAVLKRELDALPVPSLIGVGGGINDFYDAAGNRQLGRNVLSTIMDAGHKILLMTRSAEVEKDTGFFQKYAPELRPLVVMSIPAVEETLVEAMEPGLPTAAQRFKSLTRLNQAGIVTAAAYSPLIPFYNDSELETGVFLDRLAQCGVSAFIPAYVYAMSVPYLKSFLPSEVYKSLHKLYAERNSMEKYFKEHFKTISSKAQRAGILPQLAVNNFASVLTKKDYITAILLSIYYFKLYAGIKREAYRKAALAINFTPEDTFALLSEQQQLTSINGIGPVIEKNINAMYFNNDFSFYEQLTAEFNGSSSS